MSSLLVAVIGAGPAGLVTARELMRHGADVTVFESGTDVGGIWVYDGRSALYESLRTNLPRDVMAFTDYTFDDAGGGRDNWPRFPHHSAVLAYLQNFARDFDILPRIRFSETVTRVERADDGWQVSTAEGTRRFDAVAICNGHYDSERRPALPGIENFRGHTLHSKSYREPSGFTDQRVACWGTSASGFDISSEIAVVARHVYWCGNAFEKTLPMGERMTGTPSPAGFNADGQLLLETGAVDVDCFMYCTGYHYQFPFLAPGVVAVEDNRVSPLYRQIIPPGEPTLGFIGLPFLVVPFPLFEMQARWFSALITGGFDLPSPVAQREIVSQAEAALKADAVLPRHTHRLGEAQFAYCNALAKECGEPGLPQWLADAWADVGQARLKDPAGFRNAHLPVRGPTVV